MPWNAIAIVAAPGSAAIRWCAGWRMCTAAHLLSEGAANLSAIATEVATVRF